MPETVDITPHWPGLIRGMRQLLKESEPGSKSAEAARKVLIECGVDPEEI